MWERGVDGLVAVLVAVCALAIGLAVALVRTRRRWQRAVGERGWLLERERESAASAAIAAERDRIARELHDIVSHNVSLMVVQAGAAREVLGTMPDEAAAALLAVEDAGRGAMTDLRHLLGLLAPAQNGEDTEESRKGGTEDDTEDDTEEGTAGGARGVVTSGAGRYGADRGVLPGALSPQPGLDRLGPLVDRISFAGLPVEVRISGEPRPLPPGVDVTAYRIVQEALTNALRHGDGGSAEVTVRYAEHALRVEVLNTGPSVLTGGRGTSAGAPGGSTAEGSAPPHPARPVRRHRDGTGRGLLGLRERVAVYGGDLDARRRLGGGYRVRARIPLDRL
ncbi:sensor histidine kinase [Streptomyces brasiliscabiei]|uniref:sensor histidine kinase n=1 Tax=Streptomyces brasiliscabiei TaxID=2736302 RepID=UPI001C0FB2F0|nr:histidine kinase [Streptomyces brasiliscabiei]